ncbi:hypothetical protein B0H13DRAFT_2410450 [Mycena leptocephala]|nr:hypothetical protein B0H13DRAFT_2410450 [Mycena leptocephala]
MMEEGKRSCCGTSGPDVFRAPPQRLPLDFHPRRANSHQRAFGFPSLGVAATNWFSMQCIHTHWYFPLEITWRFGLCVNDFVADDSWNLEVESPRDNDQGMEEIARWLVKADYVPDSLVRRDGIPGLWRIFCVWDMLLAFEDLKAVALPPLPASLSFLLVALSLQRRVLTSFLADSAFDRPALMRDSYDAQIDADVSLVALAGFLAEERMRQAWVTSLTDSEPVFDWLRTRTRSPPGFPHLHLLRACHGSLPHRTEARCPHTPCVYSESERCSSAARITRRPQMRRTGVQEKGSRVAVLETLHDRVGYCPRAGWDLRRALRFSFVGDGDGDGLRGGRPCLFPAAAAVFVRGGQDWRADRHHQAKLFLDTRGSVDRLVADGDGDAGEGAALARMANFLVSYILTPSIAPSKCCSRSFRSSSDGLIFPICFSLYDLRPIIFAGVVRKRSRTPHNYRVLESASTPQALWPLVSRLSAATALSLLASRCLVILPFAVPFSSTGDVLGPCLVVIHFEARLHPSSPIVCRPDVFFPPPICRLAPESTAVPNTTPILCAPGSVE